MQNAPDHRINLSTVAQSAVALSVAIVFTDAVRECILAAKPISPVGLALLRLTVAILLIVVIILFAESRHNKKATHSPADARPYPAASRSE
jgi:hypothetical protein